MRINSGRYEAHEAFVAPARARSEIWRLIAGTVVGLVVYYALMILLIGVVSALNPTRGFQEAIRDGSTPAAMLFLLFGFCTMTVAAFAVVVWIHHRNPLTLFGPLWPALRDFAVTLRIMAVLAFALLVLPPWGMDEPLVQNLSLGRWAALLPLSLLAVLIQTSAEEIVFRGYIQQQLAARFSSPLIWMVLPSAVFALGHYIPADAGENAGLIALWAGLFGVIMADLTARVGNLGPAIAVHFAVNVSSLLVTSLPDSLFGLALYVVPYEMSDTEALRDWLPVDFATTIVCWLAARLAIRR